MQSSLEQFFDIVALSCIVGNGDAHLKNFGLLYQDPLGSDARLGILELAKACDVTAPTARIRQLLEAVDASLHHHHVLEAEAPTVFAAIRYEQQAY